MTLVRMDYKVALIILYDSEQRFLLQHRTDDAKLLPGRWAFFGGALEDGEEPQEGLLREALEELHYRPMAPHLILEQVFKEGDVDGYMYVYIDFFNGDKSALKLQEGQGWGWYDEMEANRLKMAERDRKIIRFISHYLKNVQTRQA